MCNSESLGHCVGVYFPSSYENGRRFLYEYDIKNSLRWRKSWEIGCNGEENDIVKFKHCPICGDKNENR